MNERYFWYQQLQKPSWAPPSWIFGQVWAVLYTIIAVSFGTVFYKAAKRQLPWKVVLPFILNLIFNFAFTPIQFEMKNNLLAFIDIIFLVATLLWAFLVVWPYLRWVVYVNIPYLLWSIFALVLQGTITYLNW